jgi:hypothetical protein
MEKELKAEPRPLWFTEVGWPLEYPRNLQVRDERQQACFVVRLFAISGAHGVKQVQIMYIEDIIYGPDGSRRSFGFYTAPGKWREQATATRVMSRLIPDPRKNVRRISEQVGGLFAYEFRGPADQPIIMAWNSGDGQLEHEFDGFGGKGAEVVDMLGRISHVAAEGGKVKVTLTEAPVYLLPGLNWRQVDIEKLLAE